MTSIVNFRFAHLFEFNAVNVDRLTETYGPHFYGQYLLQWGEYQRVAVHGPTGIVMGYVLGKVEGSGEDWHGHVSAVSIAPPFRRTGLGGALMRSLEETSSTLHDAYFVDLFVRRSNAVAQTMYEGLGYVVYRAVASYYAASRGHAAEDALDLRKALPRNKTRAKSAVIPLGRTIQPDELEWV
jgi:N-terminal acetyltransferase B complex catalytic subunit